MTVAPAANGRRDAMVRVARRRVGLKVTARLVRSKVTAIVVTARRVVLKANGRHVRSKATASVATVHRVVLKANGRHVRSKVTASVATVRRVARKANVLAANARRNVSTASAHLARRVKKAHAGHTVQRHVPRIQAPVAAHRDVSATMRANAPTLLVPTLAPIGVPPAHDVTPGVLPAAAAPNAPHSRKNAARAKAASGLSRDL
ncbi:hypothetical protein [Paraburkholderia gardini]|uniref:hypothetical protein n=1 Tax=Paraburkholderia gardini TaxID=2823469 RepID=UPI001DCB3E29|nr:hypothetical protein [Paraburkholderia gardini]CAG4886649.1 hypothetical protein R69919_00254 [Paraburkholderia gardini]